MDSERRNNLEQFPHRDQRERDNSELIEEVIAQPVHGEGKGLYPEAGSGPAMTPFKVPETPASDFHENIPQQPLPKAAMPERKKIDEINKLLSGKVRMDGGPAEAMQFLQDVIEVTPEDSSDHEMPRAA